MKSKKFIIVNAILSLVLLVVIGGSMYAWYIRQAQSESVDITTKGIEFDYILNDDDTTENTKTYNIEDVVFFDIDNVNEGKYFSDMAILVKVTVQNCCERDLDITISQGTEASADSPYIACAVVAPENPYTYSLTSDTKFQSGKKYYTVAAGVYSEATVTAGADVTASTYYERTEYALDSTSAEGSVTSFLTASSITSSATVDDVAACVMDDENNITTEGGIATFYVYVYGVQPDDDATNEFLGRDERYSFSLVITALSVDAE